ncbi:MAG TPA: hypothetical protein GX400_11430 [Chloroflexi bacterium]|nr:hypothetical protein [Chloroflexota bacterium]
MQISEDALSELTGQATHEGGAKGAVVDGMNDACGRALLAGALFVGVTMSAAFSVPALLGATDAGAVASIAGTMQGAKAK